jgi:hypothetical protein
LRIFGNTSGRGSSIKALTPPGRKETFMYVLRPAAAVLVSPAAAACAIEPGAEDGTKNTEGFLMGGLWKNNLEYKLRVVGTRIYGVRTGATTLSGAALAGSFFLVAHDSGLIYRIHIQQVISVPLWGGPYKGQATEAYRFEWSTPADPEHHPNLCADPPEGKPQGPDQLGLPGEFTVVFEGNRYDSKAKTLVPADRNWFNLGCASHVLSKLFLTGHTEATGNATAAEQQAVLKLLTADYCGDGQSFTVGGEPLYWKTANTYMKYYGTPTTLEARWNENGPVCLDYPRLKATQSALAQQLFPDIWKAIADHCPARVPPSCADPGVIDFGGQLAMSGNPYNE